MNPKDVLNRPLDPGETEILSTFGPLEAFRWRVGLGKVWSLFRDKVLDRARYEGFDSRRGWQARLLSDTLDRLDGSDTVLWKEALWHAGMAGAEDAFTGYRPTREEIEQVTPQVWMHEDFSIGAPNIPLRGDNVLTLPSPETPKTVTGIFVCPFRRMSVGKDDVDPVIPTKANLADPEVVRVVSDDDIERPLYVRVKNTMSPETKFGVAFFLLFNEEAPKTYEDTLPIFRYVGEASEGEMLDLPILEFWAALRFMREPVVERVAETISRQMRRAEERRGGRVPPFYRIALRRVRHGSREVEGSEEAAQISLREFHCQWMVQGHWRNQFYRSTGEHKPVYVHTYLKGPENQPFKPPRHRVYEVIR